MKKIYQKPEIELFVSEKFCGIEGPSENGGEATGLGNESKTFEEEELSTDMNNSSLWDN